MTPQELKASVLWAAIQGKITRQAEGESAEDLLTGLSLSALAEEECYFDIPGNWKWCKIKDIFTLVNGKAFKPTDWGQTGLPIVRIQNLNDSTAPFNYFSGEIEEKYILHGGELLFSWSGTPGTSFGSFIWNGGKAVLNQHIFIVYPQFELDTKYAMYALNGELKVFIEKAHGGAGLKHITKKEFGNCGLPIPPLAEQKRIVAKLEEILPLIDRYDTAWNKLEAFNKRFPGDMQKSILQLAIQGKLVEQRPEEGTGEELFKKIQLEKQSMIKAGKIKKEKPLREITEDEIPFDIPETWKWVRMGSIFNIHSSKRIHANEYVHDGIPFYRSLEVVSLAKGIEPPTSHYISEQRYNELCLDNIMPQEGDLLITCIGGSIGWNWIVDDRTFYYKDGNVVAFDGHDNFNILYLQSYLSSPLFKGQVKKDVSGTAYNALTIEMLKSYLIPLPPLAEQNRIVAKLEEILPLCERLK